MLKAENFLEVVDGRQMATKKYAVKIDPLAIEAQCQNRMLVGDSDYVAGYHICGTIDFEMESENCIISIGVRRNFEFEQSISKYINSTKCQIRVYDKRLLIPPQEFNFNLIHQKN
uniref:Methyltransferase domain-containing protein n=1 Tax=Ditylenchus dipsaci TaxID=166011 RepID=A0A915E500_9BILA